MLEVKGEAKAKSEELQSRTAAFVNDIEVNHMRQVTRKSLSCMVDCYDKAGNSQSTENLNKCVTKCRSGSQEANAFFQDVSDDRLIVHSTCYSSNSVIVHEFMVLL